MLLAIDPSLKGTGYCYGSTDLTYGVLHFGKSDVGKDLNDIYNFLDFVLEKNDIKYMIREGYAFGFKNNGITRIMEVGGILHMLSYRYNLKMIDVAPATLKKFITGSGKATKDEIMVKINNYIPGITDDNISDAIGLHLIGQAYLTAVSDEEYGKVKVIDRSKIIEDYIKGKI